MVNLYAKMVINGTLELEDVPLRWRAAVETKVNELTGQNQ